MRTLRRQSRIDEVPVIPKVGTPLSPESNGGPANAETGNKLGSNWDQTGNKLVTKPDTELVTNWDQSGNKPVTKSAPQKKTGNKLVTEPDTELVTNWDQSGNKPVTKPTFSALVGLQRNIMLFLYSACKTARGRSTESLTIEHIAKSIKISSGSVKTIIRRLETKGHIKRGEFKNGRGGWSKYELAETTFREMLQLESEHKLVTNWDQSSNKLVTEPDTEPDTRPLSSSSSNIATTTEDKKAAALEVHASQIPEGLKKYGFSENHLRQLLRDSELPLESIQASIEAFAHDLAFEDVKRRIRSPIALIMKLLKAGQPYLSEKGFEAEEDRLFRECVQRAEKKKTEKANLLERFFDLKFEEWIAPLSDEELLRISAPVGEFKGQFHLHQLKDHFRREVFEEFKNEIRSNEAQ